MGPGRYMALLNTARNWYTSAICFYTTSLFALFCTLVPGYDTRPHAGLQRILYIKAKPPGIAYQPQSASPIPFTSNNPRWFAVLETHHFSTWLCTSFHLTLFLLRWGVTKRARWLWHRFRGNDGSHFKSPLYNFRSVSTLDRRIWHSVKLFFKFHAPVGKNL